MWLTPISNLSSILYVNNDGVMAEDCDAWDVNPNYVSILPLYSIEMKLNGCIM